MVISKKAMTEYTTRDFCDSTKAKRVSNTNLDRLLDMLHPKPVFITEPYKHQKVVFLLCIKYRGYYVQVDMGGGKSKSMLDLFRYQLMQNPKARMVVQVPCVTNVDSWLDECDIHAPDIRRIGITPDLKGNQRLEALEEEENQIVIVTYAGWLRMVRSKNKKGAYSYGGKGAKYERMFTTSVYDESTHLGGPTSKFFIACRRLSKNTEQHYSLTGTAFGKDPLIVYSQSFVSDLGETFQTVGRFRSALYIKKKNYFTGWDEWHFDKRKKGLLSRMLKHRSIRYNENEFEDLPDKVEVALRVRFDPDVIAYYDKLLVEFRDKESSLALLGNAYVRLRRLCSGYLELDDGQEGKHQIEFEKNPKFDELVERLKQVPETSKICLFHSYVKTGEYLQKRLKKEGFKSERLWSGQKDKSGVQRRFKTSPKHRILIANEAAAFGLNLQVANYGFFYELHDSPIIYRQMMKRLHRGKKTEDRHTVYLYVLMYKNSIEESIYKGLLEGKSFFEKVVESRKVGFKKKSKRIKLKR